MQYQDLCMDPQYLQFSFSGDEYCFCEWTKTKQNQTCRLHDSFCGLGMVWIKCFHLYANMRFSKTKNKNPSRK